MGSETTNPTLKREALSDHEDVVLPEPSAKKPRVSTTTTSKSSSTVLMWFRTDLRTRDNTALSRAALSARSSGRPLVALFVVSPDEWKKHDLAPIKVHFWMRNLALLKLRLDDLHVPLVVVTSDKRWDVANKVAHVAQSVGAEEVYWNREYEINEGKRDRMATEALSKMGIKTWTFDDQCIVPPGVCKTKEDRTYTVFSPFKKW